LSIDHDVFGVDRSVAPATTSQYANGTWFAGAAPSTRSYGAFSVAAERAEKWLTEIAGRGSNAGGSDERKIGYYDLMTAPPSMPRPAAEPGARRSRRSGHGGDGWSRGGSAVVRHLGLAEGRRARPPRAAGDLNLEDPAATERHTPRAALEGTAATKNSSGSWSIWNARS
jgi:hypothetical protein